MADVPLSLLLDKIARANEAALTAALADRGLRPRHAGLLAAVAALGTPSQAEVGQWLGVGPSSVVLLVDELVDRDHLRREVDPQNRRRSRLHLTDQGRVASEVAATRMREVERDLLDPLDAETSAHLDRALRRIAAARGLAGATAPSSQG